MMRHSSKFIKQSRATMFLSMYASPHIHFYLLLVLGITGGIITKRSIEISCPEPASEFHKASILSGWLRFTSYKRPRWFPCLAITRPLQAFMIKNLHTSSTGSVVNSRTSGSTSPSSQQLPPSPKCYILHYTPVWGQLQSPSLLDLITNAHPDRFDGYGAFLDIATTLNHLVLLCVTSEDSS